MLARLMMMFMALNYCRRESLGRWVNNKLVRALLILSLRSKTTFDVRALKSFRGAREHESFTPPRTLLLIAADQLSGSASKRKQKKEICNYRKSQNERIK